MKSETRKRLLLAGGAVVGAVAGFVAVSLLLGFAMYLGWSFPPDGSAGADVLGFVLLALSGGSGYAGWWLARRNLNDAAAMHAAFVAINVESSWAPAAENPEINLADRARRRFQLARTDADVQVRRYLPDNPRTAKRIANHMALSMVIAAERGVFDDGSVTLDHLGKWVAIAEGWPPLGAALTNDSSGIAELEAARDIDELRPLLKRIAPAVAPSPELVERLQSSPLLAPVLDALVRFEP